tara:strand:+ start:8896 stop:9369 length:474 start_codon:yes stop_codon:yes gene_type:complete
MGKNDVTSVRSNGTLDSRTVADLMKLYISLVPGTPPEFKNKAALVTAIILELAKTPGKIQRSRSSNRPVEREPKNRKPWAFDPTKLEPVAARKGTKREKLIEILRKGASFRTIQEKMNWTYKQAFCQMRAVNTKNGYGFVERNKVLTIYTYEEGPPE